MSRSPPHQSKVTSGLRLAHGWKGFKVESRSREGQPFFRIRLIASNLPSGGGDILRPQRKKTSSSWALSLGVEGNDM